MVPLMTRPAAPAPHRPRRALRATPAALLSLSLAACATGGLADREPLITDRPDFTESAQSVPARMVQVETGYTYADDDGAVSHTVGELLGRFGVGPRTELRVGINSYAVTTVSGVRVTGLEDASLGAKFTLLTGADHFDLLRPDLALIVATTVPTGSSAYGEPAWQPDAKLVVGWTLTDRLAWTSNLNYAYASQDDVRFDQPSFSTSFGYAVAERVGVYAEYFRIMPESRGADDAGYLNGGVTYLVSPEFQLDARLGQGVDGAASGYFIGLGLSRRW